MQRKTARQRWRRGLLPVALYALLSLPALIARPALAAEAGDENCIGDAARRFRIPASLIRAVMDVEGGSTGRVSHNTNGSYDIGPMQINSIWLPEVERRGGSLQLLLHHGCANVHFGAWLLARELGGIDIARIDRAGFWRAVGNYHSRTPERNAGYAEKVWQAWRRRMLAGAPDSKTSPSPRYATTAQR